MWMHQGRAQQDSVATAAYKKEKLKIEEINLLSSYYAQNGSNSAVTGGVGTERLTDIATTIDVRLTKKGKGNKTHQFIAELGVDSYTSASSDKIDPATVSSASYKDVRVYPSLLYSLEDTAKRHILSAGISFSAEYDYQSIGASVGYSKTSKDNNREFSARAMAFLDTWKVILPIELRNNPSDNEATHNQTKPRNSYNLGLSLTQVISQNFQLALLADLGYQEGLLATKFNRVFMEDASVRSEKLPSTRFKVPLGLRAHYFYGDKWVFRAYYRYYQDSWNLKAHTLSFEPSLKLSAFSSLTLPYRFYAQGAADYFKPIFGHALTDAFYTSDYDLSKFTSHMLGLSYHLSESEKGLFNLKHFSGLDVRYGYYKRSNGLYSHIVTLAFQLK